MATIVRVMCPDNPQHGPVMLLETSDGETVEHRFTSGESSETWIMPARNPNLDAALEAAAARVGSQEEWDALVARNVKAIDDALDVVANMTRGVPESAVATSADPESVGAVRPRFVVRCNRPSCGLDLQLGIDAVGVLEDVTRGMWKLGRAEYDVPDVRRWLQEIRGRTS